MRDLMLVNERLHAISQLWQMAFGLDRVQWKGSPSARLIDESANQFRVSNGDTSDQFFRSTLRENRYTTRYPPQICSHPRLLLQLPRRFIGALAKSRLLLKLIKRLLFAPLSAASSWKDFVLLIERSLSRCFIDGRYALLSIILLFDVFWKDSGKSIRNLERIEFLNLLKMVKDCGIKTDSQQVNRKHTCVWKRLFCISLKKTGRNKIILSWII